MIEAYESQDSSEKSAISLSERAILSLRGCRERAASWAQVDFSDPYGPTRAVAFLLGDEIQGDVWAGARGSQLLSSSSGRIGLARRLLSGEKLSIEDGARWCGFDRATSFSALFSKVAMTSPHKYCRQVKRVSFEVYPTVALATPLRNHPTFSFSLGCAGEGRGTRCEPAGACCVVASCWDVAQRSVPVRL